MTDAPSKPWRVDRTSIYGSNDQLVATVGVFTSREDAALIAAAPELLALVRKCYEGSEICCGERLTLTDDLVEGLEVVISKVEGR